MNELSGMSARMIIAGLEAELAESRAEVERLRLAMIDARELAAAVAYNAPAVLYENAIRVVDRLSDAIDAEREVAP